MSKKVTGRLEMWSEQVLGKGMYLLWGNVYDDIHGRFPDGSQIHTSAIAAPSPDKLKEGMVVETMNSSYLLGASLQDTVAVLLAIPRDTYDDKLDGLDKAKMDGYNERLLKEKVDEEEAKGK